MRTDERRGATRILWQGCPNVVQNSPFAQACNITPEELQARLDAGDSMWVIAQEKGLSADQFTQLMQQARSASLQQAVADGTLTQAQADWMQQRMNGNYPDGYGPGSANCDGTGVRQGGRGGRAGEGGGTARSGRKAAVLGWGGAGGGPAEGRGREWSPGRGRRRRTRQRRGGWSKSTCPP